MTMREKAHARLVERQKHFIERSIRRSIKKTGNDYCVIKTRGLFQETIEWLDKLGYRAYLLDE